MTQCQAGDQPGGTGAGQSAHLSPSPASFYTMEQGAWGKREQRSYQCLNHLVTVHPQGINNTKCVYHFLLLHLLQQPVQGNEGAGATYPGAESTESKG